MRRELLWSRACVRSCQHPATTLAWFGLYDGCEVIHDEEFPRVCTETALQGPHLVIGRQEYCEKVKEIRELIAEGEIYQINFTDRLKFGFSGRPWDLFATLCSEHPTPYPAFINTGIGASALPFARTFFSHSRGPDRGAADERHGPTRCDRDARSASGRWSCSNRRKSVQKM